MNIKQSVPFKEEPEKTLPTVFHITHYKSGSQWVLDILNEVAKERIVVPQVAADHVTKQPIIPGGIYPCVYLPKPVFMEAKPPEHRKVFIVIRDLRDTLVSLYFSLRNSHQIMDSFQQKWRSELRAMDVAEGMFQLMQKRLHVSAGIQKTWINSGHLLVRYEDLNRDEQACFKEIISYCEIEVGDDALAAAVDLHSFEKRACRKRGEEDINSHHRKGVVGDWRNYFDRKLAREFRDRYGELLIQTGYEKDMNWEL